MKKKLSDMTLEELWQLFPIVLEPHSEAWALWYEEERALLAALLPGARIRHIGSTAIPGIWAKPIVDILIECGDAAQLHAAAQRMAQAGYVLMSRGEERLSFHKGYTEEGFAPRVFHLHLRLAGDCAEIAFRDYLTAHLDEAAAYEQLKLGLWKMYEHDRDGYTQAKTAFVQRIMGLARR
ncbi:MAG: GrpB family protein [Clostridia bacterium]|nr:GrpB family protein [Clostridia bacterium]